MASVCAAEIAPNGPSQPPPMAAAFPGTAAFPCRTSSADVASHTVRKHSTCRASPPATASIAAISDPPGPNVSMPPLYQVGRMPSAASSAVTPPSPKPARTAPPGYVDSPSMSAIVSPASATARSHASTVSDSGGRISRRPISDAPIPVRATLSSNFSWRIIGRTCRQYSSGGI